MNKTRVLIVDDSSTMRAIVAKVLGDDPGIEIVGQAADAPSARQAIKDLNPDVMTLDVEMPAMSGIEFLRKVMALRPMPVVMVSTLTARGSEAALEALSIGAVDCVPKPSAEDPASFADLAARVKVAARAKLRPAGERAMPPPSGIVGPYAPFSGVVAIGASTGGVEALQTLLTALPANCPPMVITQHMPASFTRSLANRLNKICQPTVQEAQHGDICRPGHVYVAPGGEAHLELANAPIPHCVLRKGESVNGHRPSVDVLFASVARLKRVQALGVILTGMGADGANGLLQMRKAGARTLAQDERTSVVYGMPKAAWALGAAEKQLPIHAMAAEILTLTNIEQRNHASCHLRNI